MRRINLSQWSRLIAQVGGLNDSVDGEPGRTLSTKLLTAEFGGPNIQRL